MITSKQRVLAAVNHQLADRVPITFDAEKEVYELLYRHFQIQTKEELFERLNVDTWMLLPGNFLCFKEDENKQIKRSIWGYKTRVVDYSGGTYDELYYSPLAGKDTISDIKNHSWPGDDALDFSLYRVDADDHSNRAIIGVFCWGTFHLATHIRGMENLMMDFAVRTDYFDYLFKVITERILMYLEQMLQSYDDGIDIVYMADDYCSQRGPLFSPKVFRKFVIPYLQQVTEIVHSYNKKFLLHVCGAVRPLLKMIIDAGVDMLEPIQIRAKGMEPEGLKRDFGSNICFYGGVDLQQTLTKGSPGQVEEEVKKLIDILGKGGGYIFGPGHTYIQIDVPVENILAMYETAFSYKPGPT